MSFPRASIADVLAAHGPVARVVVASVMGSAPREVGAAMLVWADGQSGTIGGGALEFEAAEAARAALALGRDRIDRVPLGPARGQCCGGSVTLLTETWTGDRLAGVSGDVFARPIPGAGKASLAVKRHIARLRGGSSAGPALIDGWMIERVTPARRAIWIYGAGHVGRALVAVLAPLPDFAITWVDTHPDRFPEDVPEGVAVVVATEPEKVVPHAPVDAEHLVLTYSHAIDLALCHALLTHGFGAAGLIGSRTKWARFRKRLAALGHADNEIWRIACPIGVPELGKHPHAIAIGVASALLSRTAQTGLKESTG